MSPLLEQIISSAPNNLRELLDEAAGEIDEAIAQAVVQSEAEDAKAKFSLGYKITVDLEKRSFDVVLSWNEKHTYSQTVNFEDPDQAKLIFDTDGKAVGKVHRKARKEVDQ